MAKWDFNKVANHGCSPVNLLHIFRTPLTRNTSGWLLLVIFLKKLASFSMFSQNMAGNHEIIL